MLSELIDAEKLPCGCVIGKHPDTQAFVMIPCSQTCEYFAYAIEQARKTDKPIAQLDTTQGEISQARGLSPLFSPNCPYCGAHNDAYSSSHHANTPAPGDVSVCAYCRRISLFTEHGLRKPTEDEAETLKNDEQIKAMQAAAKVVWGNR